jgi:broad specificity phosphatase PhoE
VSSRLVLIRHADVRIAPDTPVDQWGLSPEGERAAAALSHHPIVDSVQLVFSSPEPKALATARALARGRPIVPIAALEELVRSGAGFLVDLIMTDEVSTPPAAGQVAFGHRRSSIVPASSRVLAAAGSSARAARSP